MRSSLRFSLLASLLSVACGSGGSTVGSLDAGAADAQTIDAQTVDARTVDAQTVDAQTADAQTVDAQTADAQTVDAQTADAQTADAQTADAQTADAQTADAQTADAATDLCATQSPCANDPRLSAMDIENCRASLAAQRGQPCEAENAAVNTCRAANVACGGDGMTDFTTTAERFAMRCMTESMAREVCCGTPAGMASPNCI